VRLETIHPRELGLSEAALWRAHQAAASNLGSPYLTPDWARFVGAAREDARVCVIDGGRGFLGVQRGSGFAAMGLGAPIADYQGVVGEEGLGVSPGAICSALKVGRIDLSHVPSGQAILGGAVGVSDGSWIAETGGSREAYESGLKQKRGEFVRQSDKKARKFAREQGETVFAADVSTPETFETLLQWKRSQLLASGQPAIWDTPWVRQVIEACRTQTAPGCSGLLFTLHADERLAAINFCLRNGRTLHMWIIAHDDAFEAYSPGVQLARAIIGWAGDNGVDEVDFGPGDYRYKRQLATTQRMLDWGVVSGLSVSGVVRRAEYGLRAAVERLPQPKLAALPGKAMRRLDLMRALAA